MNPSIHENHLCPLCNSGGAREFHHDTCRKYFRCGNCGLIFVPPGFFISPEEEMARYDLHCNSSSDDGYCGFLKRLFDPLNSRLSLHSAGLDFGSGPGPALSKMFEDHGHSMMLYDPFYADDPSAFETAYDFITATEVFEHLHEPGMEADRIWKCLKPGGWLGIMTNPVPADEAFADWYYIRDITHVCFFSNESFRWLAERWNAELTIIEPDVILFRKSE